MVKDGDAKNALEACETLDMDAAELNALWLQAKEAKRLVGFWQFLAITRRFWGLFLPVAVRVWVERVAEHQREPSGTVPERRFALVFLHVVKLDFSTR